MEELGMYKCKSCNEKFNYKDEVVFFNGDLVVEVSEQYPDWTHCLCVECFEKENTN